MIRRSENQVFKAVISLCDGGDGCLISPNDILSVLPEKRFSAERVDLALASLENGGYIEVISSERKGEKMYVVSLKESATEYLKNAKKHKKDVLYKIFLALVGATATFVFGTVLKAVFKG